jgi:lipopolysaccharide/colanic/teichoic acid biosynthesis glycosyltransferase
MTTGNKIARNVIKRAFDIVGSIGGLIITFPLMIFISAALLVRAGRPVLYRQVRAGLRGQPFPLFKFRTMLELRAADGTLLPDENRIFALGRFLRTFSLDELPELWNVLRGEMSLVGPRPLLMDYLPRYEPEQMRRHEVKPGITGWAQIHGRNKLSWEEKFKFDVWYVDHYGFWLDLKIVTLTILKLATKEGISADGHATMPEFRGSISTGGSTDLAKRSSVATGNK